MAENNMIQIAALWKQQGRGGTTYLAGRLGDCRLMAFKNTRKEPGGKQPDWLLFVAPQARPQESKESTHPDQTEVDMQPDDADIPF